MEIWYGGIDFYLEDYRKEELRRGFSARIYAVIKYDKKGIRSASIFI
jgi:hypothetical protein